MNLAETFVNRYFSPSHRGGDFHEVMSSSLFFGPDLGPEFP